MHRNLKQVQSDFRWSHERKHAAFRAGVSETLWRDQGARGPPWKYFDNAVVAPDVFYEVTLETTINWWSVLNLWWGWGNGTTLDGPHEDTCGPDRTSLHCSTEDLWPPQQQAALNRMITGHVNVSSLAGTFITLRLIMFNISSDDFEFIEVLCLAVCLCLFLIWWWCFCFVKNLDIDFSFTTF